MRIMSSIILILSVMLTFQSARGDWSRYEEDGFGFYFQEVMLKDVQKNLSEKKERESKNVIAARAALPKIQKVLLVRDQLLSIVESYIDSANSDKDLSQGKYKRLRSILIGEKMSLSSSIAGPYNVYFEFGTTRFQVDGIEQARLAVNTGDKIIFNGHALASHDYTVAELAQIWLHEIFHEEAKTPLSAKDAWAAKVAYWLNGQTQTIALSDGFKITTVDLPARKSHMIFPGYSESLNKKYNRIDFEEQFQESIQNRFLIFQEKGSEVKLGTEVYKAFRTYSDFLGQEFPTWNDSSEKKSWPEVKILNVRKKSDTTIQFEYQQLSVPLQKDPAGNYEKESLAYKLGDYAISEPDIPQNRYVVEYNPQKNTTEIVRTYSAPLHDGDFEVHRIQDHQQKRFVSIRVKVKKYADYLKQGDSVYLLAKDLDTKVNLSVALIQRRVINQDEVLFHFELPQRNLDLSQILIPTLDKEGLYSELRLRPSKPQILSGKRSLESPNLYVDSISVSEKINKKDRLVAQFKLKANKKVTGMTLELEHSVQAVRTSWSRSVPPQARQTIIGLFGAGRKYFFAQKNIRIKNKGHNFELTLSIPEEIISQTRLGPAWQEQLSGFYSIENNVSAQTLVDSRNRKILNAWVHFEDGTNEKFSSTKLPPEFSLISQEEKNEIEYENRKQTENLFKMLMSRNDYVVHTCEGLFLK